MKVKNISMNYFLVISQFSPYRTISTHINTFDFPCSPLTFEPFHLNPFFTSAGRPAVKNTYPREGILANWKNMHCILWLLAYVSCHIQISKQWPFMHFLNGHHFVTSFRTDAIVFPVLVTKPQSIGRGKLHLFCKSYFCSRLYYPLKNECHYFLKMSFILSKKSYQLVRSGIYGGIHKLQTC